MEKQKKIALINDLTGFGRCSTAVMAPIVSALRIQAVAFRPQFSQHTRSFRRITLMIILTG